MFLVTERLRASGLTFGFFLSTDYSFEFINNLIVDLSNGFSEMLADIENHLGTDRLVALASNFLFILVQIIVV